MPYRIETQHADAGSLGPCIRVDDERNARAVAEGLRAGGLAVDLFEQDPPTGAWRKILLEEIAPFTGEVRKDRLLDEFVVIVRRKGEGEGDYELATPIIFLTRSLAEEYAGAAHPDREPLVVRGQFSQLQAG